jgi:hypothetical protein
LLAALETIARKIDNASGSPQFTCAEHGALAALIAGKGETA